MAKSPTLLSKLQSLADKLTGTVRVDNMANPDSAWNIAKRDAQRGSNKTTSKQGETVSRNIKNIYSSGKQKVFGTPLK